MMPLLSPLLLVLLAASRGAGQVFFKGECPDPPTVADFKTWLFEGTWYETQRWYSIKEKGHCMRHTFSDLGYGKMDVLTEMTRGRRYEYRRGVAHLQTSKTVKDDYGKEKHSYGQTKYTIEYDDRKGQKRDDETFFVLDTDYWTYAIIWSCSGKSMFNMQYLRILTRSPYPHSHTLVRVYRELEYLGLDQEHLVLVDDKQECTYQVAQTHYKKEGYGHGRPVLPPVPPRPSPHVSYTSLLSEVKPGGGYQGGYSDAGGYQSGYEGAPGGYEVIDSGYGQPDLGGYETVDDLGYGSSVGGGGYGSLTSGDFTSSSYDGDSSYSVSEPVSIGGGYSAPSSGYTVSSGSSGGHGGGYGGGEDSYSSYSQSGSGKYK